MASQPPPPPIPLPPVMLDLVDAAVLDLREAMPAFSHMSVESAAPVYLLAIGQLLAEGVGPGPARNLMRAAAERLPYDCLQRLDAEIARRQAADRHDDAREQRSAGAQGAASC